MRLTGSGVYSRPAPVPKMPQGLVELMEGLTRDVLKNNPTDVFAFCANHMQQLLLIRDGRAPKQPLTLEQKIKYAQEKVRAKAEERRRKYDEEMKTRGLDATPQTSKSFEEAKIQSVIDQIVEMNEVVDPIGDVDLDKNDKLPDIDETDKTILSDAKLKAPVHHEQDLTKALEVEIFHKPIAEVANVMESMTKDGATAEDIKIDVLEGMKENLKSFDEAVAESQSENSLLDDNQALNLDSTASDTNGTMENNKSSSVEDNMIENDKETFPEHIRVRRSLSVENVEEAASFSPKHTKKEILPEDEVNVANEKVAEEITEKNINDMEDGYSVDILEVNKADGSEISETNTAAAVEINQLDDDAYLEQNNGIGKKAEESGENTHTINPLEATITEIGDAVNALEKEGEIVVNDASSEIVNEALEKPDNVEMETKSEEKESSTEKSNKDNVKIEVESDTLDVGSEPDPDQSTEKNIAESEIKFEQKDGVVNTTNEIENKETGTVNTTEKTEKEQTVTFNAAEKSDNEEIKIINTTEELNNEEIAKVNTTEELDKNNAETVNTTEKVDVEGKGTVNATEETEKVETITLNSNIESTAEVSGNGQTNHDENAPTVGTGTQDSEIKTVEDSDTGDLVSNGTVTENASGDTASSEKGVENESVEKTVVSVKESDEGSLDAPKPGNSDEAINKVVEDIIKTPESEKPLTSLDKNGNDNDQVRSEFVSQVDETKPAQENEDGSITTVNKILVEEPADIKDDNDSFPEQHVVTENDIVSTESQNDSTAITNGHSVENGSESPEPLINPEVLNQEKVSQEIQDVEKDTEIQDTASTSPEPKKIDDDTDSLGKTSSMDDSVIEDNNDSLTEVETAKTSSKITLTKDSQSSMDLETAAVTIQKVFRSFLFKRSSTYDDTSIDEGNIMDDDNEKVKVEFPVSATALNKERRTLGLSRMDTVLQTVNEEKSLSLSTDDSSLSSAATIIQAHVRGFLVRNRLNSQKTNSTSLVNSEGPSTSLEADPEQKANKTVLNIHIVPEGENFLSRDESLLTSIDLSLDGSPPSSTNLHPLGYDKSEPRKQLKREDAIQSISPPSNNSGKLSEDVDSVKDMLMSDSEQQKIIDSIMNEPTVADPDTESRDDTPTRSATIETVIEAHKMVTRDSSSSPDLEKDQSESNTLRKPSLTKAHSDESDVVTPFEDKASTNSDDTLGLLHSGEFHDVVLPTKVSRSDTSVVRGE